MIAQPGSVCPIDGSSNVDVSNGCAKCNDCGGEFHYRVKIDFQPWLPTQGMRWWQKVAYHVSHFKRTVLAAFERVWCVHSYELRTVDSWEEEIAFDTPLRVFAKNIPPYFVCRHCGVRVNGKVR